MIYKFSQSQFLQCVGDFKTHCIDGGFVFVESKKSSLTFGKRQACPKATPKSKSGS